MQLTTFTLLSVLTSFVHGRPDGAQVTDEAIALPVSGPGGPGADFEQANMAVQNAVTNLERFAFLTADQQNQNTARYPFAPVRFVIPPISTIRSPNLVSTDVRTIFRGTDPANISTANSRLQELLFERLLINDLQSGSEHLIDVDRALTETYHVFYNIQATPPTISRQRLDRIESAVHNLMVLRQPLVAVLYSENLNPDAEGMARFNQYLTNTVLTLNLPRYPQNREERMLGDILRGLEVILHEVVSLIRRARAERHRTSSSCRTTTTRTVPMFPTIRH